MKTIRTIAATGAMFASAGLLPAYCAEASAWSVWEGQDASAPRAICTEDSDARGALLTCNSDGHMGAMIAMSPASMPDLLAKHSTYARGTSASVSVGDGPSMETKVRYIAAIDTIELRDHLIAAQVFNAAVTGTPLKVQTKREGQIEASFPAPDDAFKAFAKTCKALREPTAS